MTRLRAGDRFEATVTGVVRYMAESGEWADVTLDAHYGGYSIGGLPMHNAVKITPPVKVGDVVTADNIDTLPDGSIIAVPGCDAITKRLGQWLFGARLYRDAEIITRQGDYVVLRIGGGES